MDTQSSIHEVKSDVEILKRDVSNMQGLLAKLDTAIDKIATVSTDVGKILAGQESRLEQVEYESKESKRLAEKETDLLHARISQKEHEVRNDMERNHRELMEFLRTHDEKSTDSWNKIEDRVTKLESWKFYAIGITTALVFAAVQLKDIIAI